MANCLQLVVLVVAFQFGVMTLARAFPSGSVIYVTGASNTTEPLCSSKCDDMTGCQHVERVVWIGRCSGCPYCVDGFLSAQRARRASADDRAWRHPSRQQSIRFNIKKALCDQVKCPTELVPPGGRCRQTEMVDGYLMGIKCRSCPECVESDPAPGQQPAENLL